MQEKETWDMKGWETGKNGELALEDVLRYEFINLLLVFK